MSLEPLAATEVSPGDQVYVNFGTQFMGTGVVTRVHADRVLVETHDGCRYATKLSDLTKVED